MADRVQISLIFKDAELYRCLVKPLRDNKEFNSLLIKFLERYYYDEDFRCLVESDRREVKNCTDTELDKTFSDIKNLLAVGGFLAEEASGILDGGISEVSDRLNAVAEATGGVTSQNNEYGVSIPVIQTKGYIADGNFDVNSLAGRVNSIESMLKQHEMLLKDIASELKTKGVEETLPTSELGTIEKGYAEPIVEHTPMVAQPVEPVPTPSVEPVYVQPIVPQPMYAQSVPSVPEPIVPQPVYAQSVPSVPEPVVPQPMYAQSVPSVPEPIMPQPMYAQSVPSVPEPIMEDRGPQVIPKVPTQPAFSRVVPPVPEPVSVTESVNVQEPIAESVVPKAPAVDGRKVLESMLSNNMLNQVF